MWTSFVEFLFMDGIIEVAEEVRKRNYHYFFLMIYAGLPISVLNLITQSLITRHLSLGTTSYLCLYYVLLLILGKLFIKKEFKGITYVMYILQIPIYLYVIFSGTIWDSSHQAMTFFLFLVMLPVFILDRPIRHMSVTTMWMLLFIYLSFAVKSPQNFRADTLHVLQFYFGSMTISLFVLADRFTNIKNFQRVENLSLHDTLTGLRNRFALESDFEAYKDNEINVALIRLDDLIFFNDIYGHVAGDELIKSFAHTVSRYFGERYCYRYNNDTVLVIQNTYQERGFLAALEDIRSDLLHLEFDSKQAHPTFSVGYVYGIPSSLDDFREFIRHADVRVYESISRGKGNITGSEFDLSDKRLKEIDDELLLNLNAESVDRLTGLLKLTAFKLKVSSILENVIDYNRQCVIAFFNVEHMKAYNNQYGFEKGDEFIKFVAKELTRLFPQRSIARFGDDHFVLMCYEEELLAHMEELYEKVLSYDPHMKMVLDCGIYRIISAQNLSTACDKAKIACDNIKGKYDVHYCYYDDSFEEDLVLRNYILSHLDEAISSNYLKVYYQPVYDPQTNTQCASEALIRWDDPEYGLLNPGAFVEILEEAHLVHKIDYYVLETVCKDYHILKERGITPLPVSVNLSRLDFSLTDVPTTVSDIVAKYDVPVDRIQLEITERALADHSGVILNNMRSLHAMGFEVWMDDFGSEYSSLNMLSDYDFDVIKIDMKFLRSYKHNSKTASIINAIVGLAKQMNIRTLAEGVETKEQKDYLKSIGCDMCQGYFFSRPIPRDDLFK